MTSILIYAAVAVFFLVLAILLARQGREAAANLEAPREFSQDLWEDTGLRLAERVFDSGDYFWLRDEVGFPELAGALKQARQGLALEWLQALRKSFHAFVLTPEPAEGGKPESGLQSWKLLWLTLRFQFVLAYAIFVVKYFGPYHRLIPFVQRASLSPEDHLGLRDFEAPRSEHTY